MVPLPFCLAMQNILCVPPNDDDVDQMLREDELRGRVDVPGGEEDGEAEDRARGDQGLAANLVKVPIFFSSYLEDKFPLTFHDTIYHENR